MSTNDKVSVFALVIIAWLAALECSRDVDGWWRARQERKAADDRETGALP